MDAWGGDGYVFEFLREQASGRVQRDRERLEAGVQHAEILFLSSVWWQAFHNFKWLHAEYPVRDYKEGTRYIDFAYIRDHYKIAIEIDGIATHMRDITQDDFSEHLRRQNHLVIDGWQVLRFTYLDVKLHARQCQQMIQQLIGRLSGEPIVGLSELAPVDREIIRLALNSEGPITPKQVSLHTGLNSKSTRRHLRELVRVKWLCPLNKRTRIRAYILHESRRMVRLDI
ncbi:hypothetical protein [Alicyclobacillus acidiphilus]|uniref:hypothetical protein n=1 Tax=Alicyclobacillus acidiphilus TaxID=182455 RepID=UPI00082D2034|nr:hypothetical protein [Alicyclobacillus acidiphilus]